MCRLVIWTSSFEKVLFSSDAHFFIGSLIFGEFSFFKLCGLVNDYKLSLEANKIKNKN
jgi:hypothetical protein